VTKELIGEEKSFEKGCHRVRISRGGDFRAGKLNGMKGNESG
jgi:hypothetical protein